MPANIAVTVIGAGLAGLACALALARDGHAVTVLEGKSGLDEVGAGIQLPPNASHELCRWGLREVLENKVETPDGLKIVRYADGTILESKAPSRETNVEVAPTWMIYRIHYQEVLYEAAVASGVAIQFGVDVADIDSVAGDLIVPAGGIEMQQRRQIIGTDDETPIVLCNAYRALIPRDTMMQDPELAALMSERCRRI